MNNSITSIPIYCHQDAVDVLAYLDVLIAELALPLSLNQIITEQKLTQKVRQKLSCEHQQPLLIVDHKKALTMTTNQVSVSPDWKSLQRRVVSAGRKSELLLQACKLNEGQRVLDATAGFGHDSLILGSTGAKVTMLERTALTALLLKYEQQLMAQQTNWQKLMDRLEIVCADATDFMIQVKQSSTQFDVVYLDPMFPDNSYEHATSNKGAKVGKHMQALHHIAQPPDIEEERTLLELALETVKSGGRVIVKRPINAPIFANRPSDECWQNDVVRFDGYFAS